MVQRATTLGPKPSLFLVFLVVCLFLCFCFLRGFKGQVMWPKGPPHLALNPPCFVFLWFFFAFPSLPLIEKPVCFPLKRAVLFIFCVSLYLSLAFFGLPLFRFLFLFFSLSLALYFSLSLFILFFLPSCFSCKFLVLAFCFCFVCFLFQDVLLFWFFCLLSYFVLNHSII